VHKVNPDFKSVSLFDALRNRRSRRVGVGMSIPEGPFKYSSPHKPLPLTEDEEAALAFAACGVTGYALADLSYGAGQGGSMLAGRLGRTVASPDAIHAVAIVVTNDRGTWLLKRPQDFAPTEFPELVKLAREGALRELYRRSRVQLSEHRAAPPLDPGHNFPINRWSIYAPGTTYLLPVIETTALMINALLELFDESMGVFVRDERAWFRPAGLGRFARSRGGHLHDDPRELRSATIQALEISLLESMATEQGMVLQNLALMTEALGLGGFPNFARHENSWFEALGFRMGTMSASAYVGAGRFLSRVLGWLGKDPNIGFPLGLEKCGTPLLKPFCPPYFPTMQAAVRSFVETKFGAEGSYRRGAEQSAWREPGSVAAQIPGPSASAIQATAAYCEYVHQRYRRFPAYTAPFRTVIGFQVCRVDLDFYERFYRPEALSDAVRASTEAALSGVILPSRD
jgi:hypothetical protein